MTNKTEIIGRVAKDVRYGTSAKNKTYAGFTLASDGPDGETLWYDAVAFGGLAGHINNILKKGSEVKVTGKTQQKEYTKKDGGVGVSTSIFVDSVTLEGGVHFDKFSAPPETIISKPKEEAPF